MRVLHFKFGYAGVFGSGFSHSLSLSVNQSQLHGRLTFQFQFHGKAAVSVLSIQVGSYAYVLDAFFAAGIEVAVATHAAVAEEILVLEICAIAPAEHLEGDEVLLSRFQVGSQVEFRFKLAVFAISHKASVHPQIHVRCYRTEVGYDFFAFPLCRHHYFATVRAHMVVFDRHLRRVVGKLIAPGITHINVNWVAVAVKFPNGRHLQVVPTLVVERSFPEVGRARIGIFYPVEFPGAVKRHKQ